MAVPSLARVTVPEMAPVEEMANVIPLLAIPPTVTTTGPEMVLLGTGTTIVFVFQLTGLAGTLLKVIVLEPMLAPNAEPETVTNVFGPPAPGARLLIRGELPPVEEEPIL
jgi:hypothetical protein